MTGAFAWQSNRITSGTHTLSQPAEPLDGLIWGPDFGPSFRPRSGTARPVPHSMAIVSCKHRSTRAAYLVVILIVRRLKGLAVDVGPKSGPQIQGSQEKYKPWFAILAESWPTRGVKFRSRFWEHEMGTHYSCKLIYGSMRFRRALPNVDSGP